MHTVVCVQRILSLRIFLAYRRERSTLHMIRLKQTRTKYLMYLRCAVFFNKFYTHTCKYIVLRKKYN